MQRQKHEPTKAKNINKNNHKSPTQNYSKNEQQNNHTTDLIDLNPFIPSTNAHEHINTTKQVRENPSLHVIHNERKMNKHERPLTKPT